MATEVGSKRRSKMGRAKKTSMSSVWRTTKNSRVFVMNEDSQVSYAPCTLYVITCDAHGGLVGAAEHLSRRDALIFLLIDEYTKNIPAYVTFLRQTGQFARAACTNHAQLR